MNQNQKLIHLVEVYSEQKTLLLKYFESQPEDLEDFVSAVDGSDYPISEWLDALDTMTGWLAEKGSVMSLADKIQYVNCATGIIAQGAHWDNLASAIRPILEQYGCERSSNEPNKNH